MLFPGKICFTAINSFSILSGLVLSEAEREPAHHALVTVYEEGYEHSYQGP